MMSADLLRRAATVLRERAENATPGPWREEYSKASGPCVIDAESHNCLDSVARTTHYRAGGDASYIATVHPGVGLALADWLEEEAARIALAASDATDARPYEPALRAAEQILEESA